LNPRENSRSRLTMLQMRNLKEGVIGLHQGHPVSKGKRKKFKLRQPAPEFTSLPSVLFSFSSW
jgi:hypothetical protein